MKPAASAGILLFRRRGSDLQVLLAHPGGPYWSRQDHGSWSVPKGIAEPDEAPEAVAAREFAEETGFELVTVADEPGRTAPRPRRGDAQERQGHPGVGGRGRPRPRRSPAPTRSRSSGRRAAVAGSADPGGGSRRLVRASTRLAGGPIPRRRLRRPARGGARLVSEIRQVSAAVARRFLVLRHLLAPPRSLPAEPRERAARHRSARLAPVRSARGRRPQPRPRAARAHRRLPARVDRPLAVRGPAPLRDVQQEPVTSCRSPSCRWYRYIWDRMRQPPRGAAPSTSTRRSSRSCSGASATQGTLLPRDVGPREAIDWYWRPTNQVRAILEALAEVGTLGIARREGNLRVYDLAERLFPAEVLADAPPRAGAAARTGCWRDIAAHGLLGAVGQPGALGRRDRLRGGSRRRSATELIDAGPARPRRRRRACKRRAVRRRRGPRGPRPGGARGRRWVATRRRRARRHLPRAARSAVLGSRPAAPAVRLRLRLGGLRPGARSGAGATTSCRSCTATGSSGASSRGIDRRARHAAASLGAVVGAGLRSAGRARVRRPRSPTRSRAHRDFGDLRRRSRFPPGTARHRRPARRAVRGALEVRGSKRAPVGRCAPRSRATAARRSTAPRATVKEASRWLRSAPRTSPGAATWSPARGMINYVTSGVFSRLPISWAARTSAAQRQDQPRGAPRRGPRRVLLDGLLGAPRQERHARRRSLDVQAEVTFDQRRERLEGRRASSHREGRRPGHRHGDVRAPRRGRQGELPDLGRAARATSSCPSSATLAGALSSRCSPAGAPSSIAAAAGSPLLAIVVAVGFGSLAGQRLDHLTSGGWLDPTSESAQVADRLEKRLRRRANRVHRAVPRRRPRRRRDVGGVPGRDRDALAPVLRGRRRHRRHRLRPDAGPAVHQHRRRRRPTCSSGSTSTRTTRSTSSTRSRLRSRRPPATTSTLTGFGPIQQDSARLSEAGPAARRDRLAADRGARPDPRLQLADRGRACRCSSPASRSRRRSGIIGLVAQQTEMSIYVLNIATMLGPRAGDRLLAVPHEPLPRGARPRPDRRAGGRARRRHGRQGRPVLRRRGRDRAVRAALVPGERPELDRARRRDRRPRLGASTA